MSLDDGWRAFEKYLKYKSSVAYTIEFWQSVSTIFRKTEHPVMEVKSWHLEMSVFFRLFFAVVRCFCFQCSFSYSYNHNYRDMVETVGVFFIYIVVFDILCIKRLIYKQCDLLFRYMIIAILMIMQSVIIVQIIGNLEHLSLILGTLV